MKQEKRIRSLISALFLAMYIFAALVSVHFHQHQHQDSVSEQQISKTDKIFSEDHFVGASDKCFSCHLLYSNFSEVPSEFTTQFSSEFLFAEQHFAYQQKFGHLSFDSNLLRGPPAFYL